MIRVLSLFTLIVLAALTLVALMPASAPSSVQAQTTVIPTIGLPTIVPGASPVPSGTPTGTPFSTMVILGLLILIGVGIILGGIALARR